MYQKLLASHTYKTRQVWEKLQGECGKWEKSPGKFNSDETASGNTVLKLLFIDASGRFRYAVGKFDVEGRSRTITGQRLFPYVGRGPGDCGL